MGLGELYLDQQAERMKTKRIAFRTVTQVAIFNCDMIDQILTTRMHALRGLDSSSWKGVKAYTNPEVGKEFQSVDDDINTLEPSFVTFRRKRMMICARLSLREFPFSQIRVLASCFNCATGVFMGPPSSRGEYAPCDLDFVNRVATNLELYNSGCLLKDLGEMGVAMATQKGIQ